MKRPLSEDELHLWRCLARVQRIEGDHLWLVVNSWNPHRGVYLSRAQVPPAIFDGMRKGQRYFVWCNIGAAKAVDLRFENWGLAPPAPTWDEILRHQGS